MACDPRTARWAGRRALGPPSPISATQDRRARPLRSTTALLLTRWGRTLRQSRPEVVPERRSGTDVAAIDRLRAMPRPASYPARQ